MTSSADDLRGSARRLRSVARARGSDGVDTEAYDRLADLATNITDAGAAFISLVEADRDFYLGLSRLPEPLATTRTLMGDTLCSLTLGRSTPLAIDDTKTDPVFASAATVESLDIAAYLAAPIRSVTGEALGAFCLVDFSPRQWTSVEIELVVQLALAAEREIALNDPETGAAAALQSQALQRVAGAMARVGGWAIGIPDRKIYWSDEIYEILERGSVPDVDDALDMYPPGERERIADAVEDCVTNGVAFDLSLVVSTYAGNQLDARVVGEPEYDESGRIVRVIGAFQDISRQSAQARETKELADRLVETLESIPEAFYSVDSEWRFTYLNSNAEAMLGRPRASLLGRIIWDVNPTAVQTVFFTSYQRAVETGTEQVVTAYYEPLDAWFEARAYPFPGGLSVYFRDVTEEQRVQKELDQRDRLLHEQRRLLDASQDAIIVGDSDGRVTYWNDGAERVYGWSRDEAVGKRTCDLIGFDESEYATAESVLAGTGSFNGEMRHTTRTGERRVILVRWTAVRSDDHVELSVMSINTDITDARRVEEQFLRAQRLESIGTLAGGIAHDMNNVLAPIMLAVDLLRDGITNPDHQVILDSARSSAVRGSKLIQQVLLFARGADGQRIEVSVGDLLDSTAGIVRDTFTKSIELRVTSDDEVRDQLVVAEPTQLQQILLNLCVNARDALADGGTIVLSAEIIEVDEQYAALTPDADVGVYVALRVQDDGSGMSAEALDRCFEPFYTTKGRGQGTGLGLSTALAIAKSHGGFMSVYSELGRGTTFLLYLPLAGGTSTDRQSPPATEIIRGQGELVLLVDDDPAVLEVTAQTLRTFGYRVVTAVDGADAVAIYSQRRFEIDLVLTDMMMPVMDGPAAVHVLRRIRPDVPIVASSGLDASGRTAKMMELGVTHFLTKPYSAPDLLHMLRAALEES